MESSSHPRRQGQGQAPAPPKPRRGRPVSKNPPNFRIPRKIPTPASTSTPCEGTLLPIRSQVTPTATATSNEEGPETSADKLPPLPQHIRVAIQLMLLTTQSNGLNEALIEKEFHLTYPSLSLRPGAYGFPSFEAILSSPEMKTHVYCNKIRYQPTWFGHNLGAYQATFGYDAEKKAILITPSEKVAPKAAPIPQPAPIQATPAPVRNPAPATKPTPLATNINTTNISREKDRISGKRAAAPISASVPTPYTTVTVEAQQRLAQNPRLLRLNALRKQLTPPQTPRSTWTAPIITKVSGGVEVDKNPPVAAPAKMDNLLSSASPQFYRRNELPPDWTHIATYPEISQESEELRQLEDTRQDYGAPEKAPEKSAPNNFSRREEVRFTPKNPSAQNMAFSLSVLRHARAMSKIRKISTTTKQ